MTIYLGLDPGSISGAVGALDSNGDYLDSFMIEHNTNRYQMQWY